VVGRRVFLFFSVFFLSLFPLSRPGWLTSFLILRFPPVRPNQSPLSLLDFMLPDLKFLGTEPFRKSGSGPGFFLIFFPLWNDLVVSSFPPLPARDSCFSLSFFRSFRWLWFHHTSFFFPILPLRPFICRGTGPLGSQLLLGRQEPGGRGALLSCAAFPFFFSFFTGQN